MGCFLVCFGNPKHRKPRKWAYKTTSRNQYHEATEAHQTTLLPKEEDVGNQGDSTELKVRLAEQSNCSSKKKVTFDSNVQTYQVATTSGVSNVKKENEEQEETKESKSFSGLITSSRVSSPTEHRYTSSVECKKEYQDKYLAESDLEDEDDEVESVRSLVLEESSESLFSLSIDSRKCISAIETGEKEVNSPMPVRSLPYEELKTVGSKPSESVHWILAPIENLTQKKPVQAKIITSSENQEKENTNSDPVFDTRISPEPNLKQSNGNLKPKSGEQDIGVDTSLSNWLVVSEFTPRSESSNTSAGNSPSEKANSIRCPEKPKQVSALSSPAQSRSQSPNKELIMGTVGSYWIHTGQMDSESESDSTCREGKTRDGH